MAELGKSPEKRDQSKIQTFQMKYQRETETFTLFQELMKNAHQMMMALIRNLRMG